MTCGDSKGEDNETASVSRFKGMVGMIFLTSRRFLSSRARTSAVASVALFQRISTMAQSTWKRVEISQMHSSSQGQELFFLSGGQRRAFLWAGPTGSPLCTIEFSCRRANGKAVTVTCGGRVSDAHGDVVSGRLSGDAKCAEPVRRMRSGEGHACRRRCRCAPSARARPPSVALVR